MIIIVHLHTTFVRRALSAVTAESKAIVGLSCRDVIHIIVTFLHPVSIVRVCEYLQRLQNKSQIND